MGGGGPLCETLGVDTRQRTTAESGAPVRFRGAGALAFACGILFLFNGAKEEEFPVFFGGVLLLGAWLGLVFYANHLERGAARSPRREP